MLFIYLFFVVVYNVTSLFYFRRYFPEKNGHWIYYIYAVSIYLLTIFLLKRFQIYHISSIILYAVFMVELKLLFEMDFLHILHGAGVYVIVYFNFRGIVVSIFSLIYKKGIGYILEQDFYYYVMLSIALLICTVFFAFIKKTIVPNEKVKYLIRNTSQIKFLAIFQVIYLFYMLLINDGSFLDLNFRWFTILYLQTSVTAMALLAFIWNNSVRVSVWMEYELYTDQLQEQLARQMSHYKSYKKHTESFRVFKHDYVHMMAAMKSLIRRNDNEKALKLIDEIHDTMQKEVQIHRKYSDYVLLDAMLQDTANSCEEKNIRFSVTLHMPQQMILTDLDVVRVFSNVLNNAIEACVKVPVISERFLEISGSANEDWSVIELRNSFSGEIRFKGEELLTTKENKDFHGIGLKVVKDIIEGAGGMVRVDVDQEKKVFRLRLHIPRDHKGVFKAHS